MSSPFPPSGSFIASVRSSCKSAAESAGIKISTPSIDALLLSLSHPTFLRLKSQHGLVFPLAFPSLSSEINFLSLLALLNTLSGYRAEFHAATGDGAYQNVLRLMMGLYLTGEERLSAKGLKGITGEGLAGLLGVSLFEEKAHPTLPGVTVGSKGGPLVEPIELIQTLCNETGEILLANGYESLGELVEEILEESKTFTAEKGDLAGAELFIEKLVTSIPGFSDLLPPTWSPTPPSPSLPIYIFKKAFFLLFALHSRLSPSSATDSTDPAPTTTLAPAGRRIPNPDVLPMFVDNVLPTMLVHLKIIDLSDCTLPALAAWGVKTRAAGPEKPPTEGELGNEVEEGPRLSKEEAYTVRAAVLYSGQVIKERARDLAGREGKEWLGEMNEVDIDGYLWAVAKDDKALRRVPRMVEKGTIMY